LLPFLSIVQAASAVLLPPSSSITSICSSNGLAAVSITVSAVLDYWSLRNWRVSQRLYLFGLGNWCGVVVLKLLEVNQWCLNQRQVPLRIEKPIAWLWVLIIGDELQLG